MGYSWKSALGDLILLGTFHRRITFLFLALNHPNRCSFVFWKQQRWDNELFCWDNARPATHHLGSMGGSRSSLRLPFFSLFGTSLDWGYGWKWWSTFGHISLDDMFLKIQDGQSLQAKNWRFFFNRWLIPKNWDVYRCLIPKNRFLTGWW